MPFRKYTPLLLLILVLVVWGWGRETAVQAQDEEITDVVVRNLSNTAPSSTQPILLADKAGNVHLFWSEDVNGRAAGRGTTSGNTIMYSRWDGVSWSQPVDIQLTPIIDYSGSGEPSAWQPKAAIDDDDVIHLTWMGQYPERLYYSQAKASEAGSGLNWSEPEMLVKDLSGTTFSSDLQFESPNTLYLVYARVHWEDQYAGSQPRALSFMKSTDGGMTWSESKDIAVVPDLERGFSNVSLLVVPDGNLFATYTEWDLSGNGQVVYVVRSLDGGETWDSPVRLAERAPNDYERDWVQMAWLEGDKLVLTWEGGFRAYRQFMYSDDFGVTWTEPEDTFYWLIGENGYTEFARDGAGRLHLFIAQRVREGSIGRYGCLGLWHSTWQGDRNWSDPELVGGCNNMVDPRVVIANGNQLVAAWYSSLVGEIMVLTGTIQDAPYIEPQPLLEADSGGDEGALAAAVPASDAEASGTNPLLEVTRPPLPQASLDAPLPSQNQIGLALLLSLAASLLLIGAITVIKLRLNGR